MTVVSNKMVTAVCAPYVESTITTIFNQITEKGLYQGLCFFLDNFFENLRTVDLFSAISLSSDTYGILCWFFINYLVILFCLLFDLVKNRKRMVKNRTYYYEATFFLTGFLVGYCALYSAQPWTLCRGINTGFLMALIYLSFTEKENLKSGILVLCLFQITAIWGYYGFVVDERWTVSQNRAVIEEEKQVLQEVIILDSDAEPWENTIATYGNVDFRYLALPTGFGSNYMIDMGVNELPGYAVISQGEDFADTLKSNLLENRYTILLEDELFIVLQNEGQSDG